jgi:hypothetical protein
MIVTVAFGTMVASASPTYAVSDAIVLPALNMLKEVSGFFINVATISVYMQWARWLSVFYYGLDAYYYANLCKSLITAWKRP